MFIFTKVCISMIIFGSSLSSDSPSDYEMTIELEEPCPGNEKNPAVSKANAIVRKGTNKFAMNGTVHVKETLDGNLNMVIVTTRCNLDSTKCVEYDTSRIGDLCAKIKFASYMNFIENIRPRVECPIRPNFYAFNDAVVDTTLLVHPSYIGYKWHHMVKVLKDNRKLIFCFKVKTYSHPKKKKPHSRHYKPQNGTEISH